ncbi:MAG: hypothetical protein ACE5GT_15460, partial [Rhodospirillales bacterium]
MYDAGIEVSLDRPSRIAAGKGNRHGARRGSQVILIGIPHLVMVVGTNGVVSLANEIGILAVNRDLCAWLFAPFIPEKD